MEDVLREIVAARRRRYGAADSVAAPPPGVPHPAARNPFLSALRARAGRAVVAEVKLGSPRLGSLVGRVDPELQAELYGRVGASALSVVVEPDFFFGSWELLARAKAASGLPALAKDFLVSPRQVDEAARAGADALLLVAALYDAAELGAWAARIRSAGMAPLVEIHAEAELRRLERAGGGWELVGVNARDLRDFSVDLGRSARLAPRLPAGALRVAESGISGRGDLDRLAAAGFDAFLVGESLLLADDPAARLAELVA